MDNVGINLFTKIEKFILINAIIKLPADMLVWLLLPFRFFSTKLYAKGVQNSYNKTENICRSLRT